MRRATHSPKVKFNISVVCTFTFQNNKKIGFFTVDISLNISLSRKNNWGALKLMYLTSLSRVNHSPQIRLVTINPIAD